MNIFSIFSRKRRRHTSCNVVQFQRAPLSERKNIPFRRNLVLKTFQRYFFGVFGVSTFFVLIILLASPIFRVHHIDVERKNLNTDITSIESFIAEKTLSQSLFFLSRRDLEKEIVQEFPQWKSIHIQKKFPNTLVASVETFSPFATVKVHQEILQTIKGQKTPKKTIVEEAYVINERGDVSYADIGETPSFTIIYKDIPPQNIALGTHLVPFAVIQKIQFITESLLSSFDLVTKEIWYYNTAKEAHINVFQFSIWVDLQQDISMQLKKFSQALGFLNKNKLEYIDLRISNRVIYKEK